MAQSNNSSKNGTKTFFSDTLFSALLSLAITLIITLILSFVIIKIKKHELFYPTISVALQCLCAFLAGRVMAKKYQHSTLLLGLLEGIVVSVILFLISLIVTKTNINFETFFSSLPYIISSAVFGSVTSVRRKKVRRT